MTTPYNPARARELLEILSKATATSWNVSPIVDNTGRRYSTLYEVWVNVGDHCGLWADRGSDLSNARAIAKLPDLATELRAALAEIERLRHHAENLQAKYADASARAEGLEAERYHYRKQRETAWPDYPARDASESQTFGGRKTLRQLESEERFAQECGGTIDASACGQTWPDETRIDIIGSKTNDGDHYRAIGQPPKETDE